MSWRHRAHSPCDIIAPAMKQREQDKGRAEPVRDARYGIHVGNYVLHERLGKGGMASVYRATHRIFNEPAAVKLLDAGRADHAMRRRFLSEAQAMRRLSESNRHVVRALDVGETEAGEAYLVMEYLPGRDLEKLLKAEGPLDWARLSPIALQICDALAATHAMNILHRDIKPQNCVLTGEGDQQLVKLIDFGIAKDLDATGEQTEDGIVLGTVPYLAPELFVQGTASNARTDIYALGATLYCLLTGHPPHEGHSATSMASRHASGPPPAPSALRPRGSSSIPHLVDEIVLRALHIDPGQRYQSITELANAIQASMEPQVATEPTALRQPAPIHQLRAGQASIRALWGVSLVCTLGFLFVWEPPPRTVALPAPPPGAAIQISSDPEPPQQLQPPPPEAAIDDGPDGGTGPEASPEPEDPPKPDKDSKPKTKPKPPPLLDDGLLPVGTKPKPRPPESDSTKVSGIVKSKLSALRAECAELAMGPKLQFTLVVSDKRIEAVDAQPGLFRRCVRDLFGDESFPVKNGRYSSSFKRQP